MSFDQIMGGKMENIEQTRRRKVNNFGKMYVVKKLYKTFYSYLIENPSAVFKFCFFFREKSIPRNIQTKRCWFMNVV